MKKTSIIFSLLLLSACGATGDAKEMLGMNTKAPDEFAVQRKPRLDVPPSFKLRPPAPGEAPLNAADPRDVAKEKLIGSSSDSSATDAEKNLLSKTGATSANSNIRGVLDQEYPRTEDKDVIDRIRDISDKNSNKTLVDPAKEKERIETNKKEDKPITEGETPSKSENEGKSVIDKIFN